MHSTKDTTSNMPTLLENRIRLATEAAKSTKKSYAQDFLNPERQQVFILQYTGTRERKPCSTTENWRTTENEVQPRIAPKRQQSQQTTHKNMHESK
jgi:hypothetical protein